MTKAIKILAVVTTIGMFIVLVAGATVTNTGSEHGCGNSWPLCHGKLVPQFVFSTAVEYIHRVDAAFETVLILALAAGAWYLYGRRREIRILAPMMVGFLFLQAGLGAWAVMYPQVSAVLALHFGVSLVAFATVLLTTLFLLQVDGSDALRDRPIPAGFRRFVWALAAYSYVVVYSGAYVRHTNADDACSGWPLCNGAVLPQLQGKVASAFGHRIGAAVLTLTIVVLLLWARRLRTTRPDLHRGAMVALHCVVLQALIGAAVAWTGMSLASALAHAAGSGLLFGALSYLCMRVLPRACVAETKTRGIAAAPAARDVAGVPH